MVLFLAAGCTDGTPAASDSPGAAPSTGSSDSIDPCRLLTAADLASVTGLEYQQVPTPESDFGPETPGRVSCHYEELNDTDGLPGAAWVTLFPESRANFDDGRDALMQLPLGLHDIDGVGETAYGDDDEIRAFDGSWYIEVQVEGAGLQGTEAITSLAQTVLSRLP